jgi:hypothetical protein
VYLDDSLTHDELSEANHALRNAARGRPAFPETEAQNLRQWQHVVRVLGDDYSDIVNTHGVAGLPIWRIVPDTATGFVWVTLATRKTYRLGIYELVQTGD